VYEQALTVLLHAGLYSLKVHGWAWLIQEQPRPSFIAVKAESHAESSICH
jgi:hypothetical protein